MPTIATDGRGNYLALDSTGNWVPTSAPDAQQSQQTSGSATTPQQPTGDEGFAAAPPAKPADPPPSIMTTPNASNIGTAAARGWKGGAVFQDEIDKADKGGPVGPYGSNVLSYWIGSPLMKTLDLFPQTVNALYQGGQQAVEEAVTPFAGRAAGHEIAGMPEAFLGSPGSMRPAIPDVPAPAAWPPRQFGPAAPGMARPFVQEYHGEPVPGSYGPPTAPPPPPPPGPPSFVPPNAQPGTLQRVTSAIQADTAAQATRPAEIPPNTNTAVPDPIVAPGNTGGAVTTIRNPQIPQQPTNTLASPALAAALQPPVPPRVAPVMTGDEILARSQGYYSPADKQAAQGATINPAQGDAVRRVLTSAIPTDPEKAALVGNTPIVQLGKSVQPFTGQPMSFDTAMSYDRQLTTAKQTALRAGDNDMARQLGEAQDAIRDKMQSLGPNDTTGDPSALANLAQARQAYSQYVKQSQMEDLQYRAGLLPEDKRDAYMRSQATSMLRGNQTRNWSPEERAALEQALKSGNISTMGNIGLSLIKPFAQAGGATIGSTFGTPGAIVGGVIGGELGATTAGRIRAARSQFQVGPVSQQISQGVPPPNTLGP